MFSISHLVVVLVIVVLLFGTGKLKSIGSDLGAAIKGFKKAVGDDETDKDKKSLPDADKNKTD
jgi:sec-independent protein translocase protein TatA